MSSAERVTDPVDVGRGESLRSLLEYAVLAPSGHNTQPWLFLPRDNGVDIYADWDRALPVLDPTRRELVMSGGAALFHLRVAARHFGRSADIVLLPDPSDPSLLARVRLSRGASPSAAEEYLFKAIPSRRTNWLSFSNRPLPAGLTEELRKVAESEGAGLRFVETSQRERLRTLIVEADHRLSTDDEFLREMAEWLGDEAGDSSGRGMPLFPEDVGGPISHVSALGQTVPVGNILAEHHSRLAEQAAQIAVLFTATDSTADWLCAGQALDHVLLRAATEGVSASFLSGPIQVDSLRPSLRDLIGGDAFCPLTVLGLGYAPLRARRTPRRAVDEMILSAPPPRIGQAERTPDTKEAPAVY